jgi:hypothetical protein
MVRTNLKYLFLPEVFARYWPGHVLLRAPFTYLGVSWLLNVLLAVGCIYNIKYICRTLFSEHPQAS